MRREQKRDSYMQCTFSLLIITADEMTRSTQMKVFGFTEDAISHISKLLIFAH